MKICLLVTLVAVPHGTSPSSLRAVAYTLTLKLTVQLTLGMKVAHLYIIQEPHTLEEAAAAARLGSVSLSVAATVALHVGPPALVSEGCVGLTGRRQKKNDQCLEISHRFEKCACGGRTLGIRREIISTKFMR